ncbi:hypothetical protein [Pseudomonas sp. LP_7_YM]|uniref:hypothetical protein n=1 Tax=Pseudomonas sp. LP_7_YM TaxID=2485137 RepID=UPI00105D8F85|nr:hypothetical protein [Pseudomonas sp. LP_7_YM]
MDAFKSGSGKQNSGHNGGQVSFGGASGAGMHNAQVNFGGPSSQPSESRVNATQKTADGNDTQSSSQVRDLVQQILQLIAQMMQKNQNGTGDQTAGSSSQPVNSSSPAANAAEQPAATSQTGDPTGQASATPQTAAAEQPASTPLANNAQTPQTAEPETTSAAASTPATDAATSVDGGQTAGSGPRSFNITNTQDHPIKIGQFDQHDKLTAELTLQPGEKGTMKFENDTTGLLKQADADGTYKPDASRLEFYNGFINTSDIDGRNASIEATDGKGFKIGDSKSIADKASNDIVSVDSAGDKTVAGYYDGSTDKMQKGGDFLTQQLGTDMTYMHPNDDTLGQGKNPMRHTDSMSLDVTFGKA